MRNFFFGVSLVFAGAHLARGAELGEVLWQFATGDSVVSSPVLDSAGNAYFGSLDHSVYALDPNGQLLWSFDTGDWVESSPALSPDESRLYVGTWDDRILALNTADGSLAWEYATGSLVYASPAVASDGSVYVGSSDGFFYALNADGTLKWDVEIGGELDSSPAIDAEGNVYLGTSSGEVIAFDSEGNELWSWDVPFELGTFGRDRDITSSPMLCSTGAILVGCKNYYVYGISASDGALLWRYETGGELEGSFVEGMGRSALIAGRDGYLYSFSWDGELNWRTFIGSNYYSSPCVDGMGRIYVGSLRSGSEGALTVLAADGRVLRESAFSSFVDSSPALRPDGTLLVGNNDGKLYALEGGDKQASLGWARFRGGARGWASLEGYVDLTGTPSTLTLSDFAFAGVDGAVAHCLVQGGGPMEVLIRGLGATLEQSGDASGYGLSLSGSSGVMAQLEAQASAESEGEAGIAGWLEPGQYVLELTNESEDRSAFFLDIRLF